MNRKGFSLAEMLISLLIIGIIVAVSTPVIVRGKTYTPENIWHWTESNNAVFFGTNDDQKVIIGNENAGDGNGKLVISQNNKSAIDLYTHPGTVYYMEHKNAYGPGYDYRNPRGINYAGRISSQGDNIAFGIGALSRDIGEQNTAIGHFSQLSLDDGYLNTAVGYSALRTLNDGNNNTVIGYAAGENIYSADNNVMIGYGAGRNLNNPESNTIIGSGACLSSGIGTFAKGNICIGYSTNENKTLDNKPRLYIGNAYTDDAANNAPIITGVLDNNKEINFNTGRLSINSYDGSNKMFDFSVTADTTGKITADTTAKYYDPNDGGYGYTGISVQPSSSDKAILSADIRAYDWNVDPEIIFYGVSSTENKEKLKIKFAKNEDLSSAMGQTIRDLIVSSPQIFSIGSGFDLETSNDWNRMNIHHDVQGIKSEQGLEFNFNNNKIGANHINLISTGDDINIKVPEGHSVKFDKTALYIGDIDAEGDPVIEFREFNRFTNNGADFEAWEGIQLKSSVPEKNIRLTDTNGNVFSAYSLELTGLSSFCNINVHRCMQSLYSDLNRKTSGWYSSDIRLKNIKGDSISGIDEINKLKIKNFTYKNDKKKELHVGVIAQDLQNVFPDSVFKGEDGYLRIETDEMFYAVVNSIKQLHQKLKSAAIKITGLEKRIKALESENKRLRKKNEEFEKRFAKLEAKKALNGKDAK